ncbi:type II toxin-antitoxin system ParD family antitoxin [Alterisphingorhabdus coralli]|uniref:Type II toxin-antitoxin system ParD family antitoxin n=1 Tax=Alterisphingorhabdus coralli TaxID=3071408 RepID=A0AA97I1B8_9SPHN|nr:type II toxin-antitoxin system ParD family antitoxin [Parasphingorhabdus sp. SCSIO 66989]WOE75135.1 type II toxin-antitoxin system ParD family antitoxin [Parasphingorhabdus sp. SCSIO 66989]
MATMNISLPDEMKAFVEAQVKSGLYANASDFFRDAIRDRMWTREALLEALVEGEKSGIDDLSPREAFEEFLKANP